MQSSCREGDTRITLEAPDSIIMSSQPATLPTTIPVIYPVTRIIQKPGDERVTESLLEENKLSEIELHGGLNDQNDSELNRNNKHSSVDSDENHNNVKNSASSTLNNYLSDAEKVNVESNRRKYFSGLKSNLQADMETFLELIWALCYLFYGVTVSIILTFIPRRFRYKDVSGQVVLVTGAGSGIGKMMAKKLALNHGARIVAWDINKQGMFNVLSLKR